MKDLDSNPIGIANTNPILDTSQYLAEFLDGHEEAIHANLTTEYIYAQVNEDGHRNLVLDEIVDHRCDPNLVVAENDSYLSNNTGQKSRIRSTIEGWDLSVSWKDDSTDFVPLKQLKESYPVKISEYSLQKNISHHPAFVWWVNHVARKKKIMISKIKPLYLQTTHRYGAKLPKTSGTRNAQKCEMFALFLKNLIVLLLKC